MKRIGIEVKRNIALAVTGICVGVTSVYLRGKPIDGMWDFIIISIIGYFATALIALLGGALSLWYIGDPNYDLDKVIIIVCATLIATCIILIVARAGGPGLDYYNYFY